MDLNYKKVTDVISLMGYLPGNKGNEHIWRNVINGIPYGVIQ
jgi:hypothetical protein